MELRPLFPFRQAQYVQVFLLIPASFCTLFAGLDSTYKSAISFSSLSLALSSPLCLFRLSFYFKLSGRSRRNCVLFPPVLSGYNESPDTRFSWGTTRLMGWSGRKRYSCLFNCLVVSLLLSLVSTLLFSRTGGVLPHLNALTPMFSISAKELVLPRHARCVLSRFRCNGHSLLLSPYLSRIGRIENPSCSACGHLSQNTSHLILHCPATDSLHRSLFGDSLSVYYLCPRPGELPGFWSSMVFRRAFITRKGSGCSNNNNTLSKMRI